MTIQQFTSNKKSMKKTLIIISSITIAFLIFGLIFIGASKLYFGLGVIPGFEDVPRFGMGGFTVLERVSISTVLSDDTFAWFLADGSQLGLLKAGIVFAVILTPIFLVASAALAGYYYVKFIRKTTDNKATITN